VTAGARPTVLVGLMGSGKTTVGRALATALAVPFLDNDTMLDAACGSTAASIVAGSGVEALHAAEAAVARSALDHGGPAVVALAASVADDPAVVDALRASEHHVVWLRAAPATLERRIAPLSHRPRAAALGESIAEQAARRAASFGAVADQVLDVDGRSPADLVAAILSARGDLRPAPERATGSAPS
jgi:shikimate kinase